MAHSVILMDEYVETLQGSAGNGTFADIKTEYLRLDGLIGNTTVEQEAIIHEALEETQEWLEAKVSEANSKQAELSGI